MKKCATTVVFPTLVYYIINASHREHGEHKQIYITMKTFRLFAALMMAVVCVGLSSCSKDDDEKIGSSDDLVGKWELTWTKGWELNSDGTKDEWDEADDGEFLIFKNDGTGYVTSGESGATIYPYTWKFENNNFSWNYISSGTTKIIKLNSESLVLEITRDSQEINTYKRVSAKN